MNSKSLIQKVQDLIKRKETVYILPVLFIIINSVLIYKENYFGMLVPLALLVVLLVLFKLDFLLMGLYLMVPLSIPLKELVHGLPFDMALPTEPILFGVLLVFIFKLLTERKFDSKILKHPITYAIYFNLGWMFITSITSTMPGVSFKFLTSRLWFLVSFYFLATQLFANFHNIKRSYWMYIIPLIFVIGYTITRHIQYGVFDKQVSHWVMEPFYNDHTSYSAIIAMYIPVIIGMAIYSRYSLNLKVLLIPVIIFFIIGEILSYSRAGWLSLVIALVVFIIIILNIRFKLLLAGFIICLGYFFINYHDIMWKLERNRQDSSARISEHVKSVSNISTDASNLERVNRWNSAIRMFERKPFFGWGPGTYMFKYAPFQLSSERTIISTNAGDLGNAHSEYIGPLAESGFLGTLSFLLICGVTIYTAIKLYRRLTDKETKMLVMVSLLGLITYYIHGFLNNFLDTDKASMPFWTFTAIIVAIDVYHSKKQQLNIENSD